MEEKKLLDAYRRVGTDMTSLKESLEDIDSITKTFEARGRDLMLLSVCNIPEYQQEGFTPCYILTKEYVDEFMEGKALHVFKIPNEKIGQEVLAEVKKNTGLIALFENRVYSVSAYALPLLLQRAEVAGHFPIRENGIIRDLMAASGLFACNERMTVVYREDEGIRKIFAFMGGKYIPVKQRSLLEVLNSLKREGICGEYRLSNYLVDHEYTDIEVSFPEMAEEYSTLVGKDVIPGVILSTSDIGSSSVRIRGIYRIGGHRVLTEEVGLRHTKGLSEEKILKEVDDKIFKDFRKLPETLVKLIGISVAPEADLTTEKGKRENEKTIGDAYEALLKTLYPTSCTGIGHKKRTELLEAIKSEINPEVRYTAYDIAANLMGLPERIDGLGRDTLEKMEKAGSQAPYATEKYFTTKPEPDKEITLLSA